MGGRIAEEIIYGKDRVTTGAGNDLQKAAEIARDMVINQGMGDKLRDQVFHEDNGGMVFDKITHEPHIAMIRPKKSMVKSKVLIL